MRKKIIPSALFLLGTVLILPLISNTALAQNTTNNSTGNIRILMIAGDWPGQRFDSSHTAMKAQYGEKLAVARDYWKYHSFGVINNFSVTYTQRFNIASTPPSTSNPKDPVQLQNELKQLARNAGFNLGNFDQVITSMPSYTGTFGFGGLGSPGFGVMLPGNDNSWVGWIHELGHAFGSAHAGHYEGGSSKFSGFNSYSDGSDGLYMMGSEGGPKPAAGVPTFFGGSPRTAPNVRHSNAMGHLTNAHTLFPGVNTTVRLFDMGTGQLSSGKNIAAVVTVNSGSAAGQWWLSYSPKMAEHWSDFNASGWLNGINCHHDRGGSFPQTGSIDFTPGSQGPAGGSGAYIDSRDGALTIGNQWTFPGSNVQLKPLSTGTQDGVRYIDVRIVDTNNPGGSTSNDTSFRYDFGTSSSPLAGGYRRATASSFSGNFASWLSTPANSRNRNSGTSLSRDLVQGPNAGILSHNLSNGTWNVKWTMGDTAAFHDRMGIKANGITKVSEVTNSIGQLKSGNFDVSVTNGNLQLEFFDGGGTDVNWVVNSLELTKSSGTSSGSNQFKFDFGTPNSAVAGGWTRVSEQTTSGAFRWLNSNNLSSRDRNIGSNLRRDLVQSSQPRTFRTNVSNGTWEVKVTLGDYSFLHDNMAIKAEGSLMASNITRNQTSNTTTPFTVSVSDGNLDLEFLDQGGSDANWAINAVELNKVTNAPAPTVFKFDFGKSNSPVASGWTRVSEQTTSGSYRWLNASNLSTRDRNIGSELRRDLIQSSQPRTFRTNVSNGFWLVKITFGDYAAFHDNMAAKAEGVLKASNVTRDFASNTTTPFNIFVNDGTLDLEFLDQGGIDQNWAVNAVELIKQ